MRSEQDRRMSMGRERQQRHSPSRGGERVEGQYEKDSQYQRDPWRADWRSAPPQGTRDARGSWEAGPGYGDERRTEHRAEDEEPYEPAEGYEPFEPGHPRQEGVPFGAGPPPRYLGTGYPGRGGPGFTGGYYGFGTGSLEPDWRAGRRHPSRGEGSSEPESRSLPRYPPGPKGYQRSDERLREDISERLMQARHIDSSDVTVQVAAAKVILEGTVPERRMKHAIEDLVDACPGVQDIENGIRVKR
ncbi:MAG TPA: BON domain-containing protein [Steroidobacteraceae bacterium]|nr:BON domain-containing protein [Steroidobacteraceae bacterium]